MIVYVLRADCGDYYCEGEHFLGVFSTQRLAESVELSPKWWDSYVTAITVDDLHEDGLNVST